MKQVMNEENGKEGETKQGRRENKEKPSRQGGLDRLSLMYFCFRFPLYSTVLSTSLAS